MTAQDGSAVSRRRVLAVAAAGAGAASAAGVAASCTTGSGSGPARSAIATARPLADAVLAAFQTHRLVGLGEIHDLQTQVSAGDMRVSRQTGRRSASATGCPAMNASILSWYRALPNSTTMSSTTPPSRGSASSSDSASPWDEPMYEQVYRTVRAANWAQPPGKRMRVLAGDPPIDWAKITNHCERMIFLQQRDAHFASVVQHQVLAKGRRALLCKGASAFIRPNAIEQHSGQLVYAIADLAYAPADPGRLANKLSRYPRYTVIPAAGTWLGAAERRDSAHGPGSSQPRRGRGSRW